MVPFSGGDKDHNKVRHSKSGSCAEISKSQLQCRCDVDGEIGKQMPESLANKGNAGQLINNDSLLIRGLLVKADS